MSTPVFRFAPSPNGFLHLGHALSAFLNFDMAREAGGRFLLRIEDIDRARCRPHFEAAIYQLEGRVRTRYGPGLAESIDTEAGDFLFIPPGLPHQAVNLSATERAVAVVARNIAGEQETVVPYEPTTA